jgi:thiol-disulfide isomerase/thioredoxin
MVAAFAVVWLSAAAAPAGAPKPAPLLKVGDPAPALNATRWLRGDPLPKFAPGKVYVVEFWATWCGALHAFVPYLTDLQARYKDRGVTVIAFTCRDIRGVRGNTEEDVTAFLRKHRPAPGYTIAYADDDATADAWLKASGQQHFCTFVVDRAGRIAYMGHPMFLDIVLPRVLAGASAKAVGEEMDKVVAEYQAVHEGLVQDFLAHRDLKPGLRAVRELEARYPPVADLLTIIRAKLSLLPKHGEPGEGNKYALAVVSKAIERKDVVLLGMAYSILRNEKENKDLLALALTAARARVDIDGGTNARSLLDLAEASLVCGDKARAKECARQAVEAAAGEASGERREIENEARRLTGPAPGGADEDGFVRLFPQDGVPRGWVVRAWNDVAIPVKGAEWTVKDGVLRSGRQRGTWLMSAEVYGDFVLEFEIKLTQQGNSGVALRAPMRGDPAFDGMELQVADYRYNPEAKPSELTGGIYRAIAPSKQIYRPTQWNRFRVELRGRRLKVTLNGEVVQDVDLDHFDKPVKRHDGSDAPPVKDRPGKGHIGFQHLSRGDDAPVLVRGARIKLLK